MLRDLDESLEQLIVMGLPDLGSPVAVSFAPPDETFPPEGVSLPALDLFLYEVRENRQMAHGSGYRTVADGEAWARRAEPVWIDAAYLVTAWTSGGARAHRDEHHLLGLTLAILLQHPVVPRDLLQGRLRHSPAPVRALAVPSERLQSMGEFWQAMGGKPKACIGLTTTFAVTVDESARPIAPVRERIIDVARKPRGDA